MSCAASSSLLKVLSFFLLYLLSVTGNINSLFDSSQYAIELYSSSDYDSFLQLHSSLANQISLPDQHGKLFKCLINNYNTQIIHSDDKSVPSAAPSSHNSYSSLSSGCFIIQVDYWSYRLCPFDRIIQFHPHNTNPSMQHHSMQFDLGVYDSKLDSYSDSPSYIQYYHAADSKRNSRVEYYCNLNAKDSNRHTAGNNYYLLDNSVQEKNLNSNPNFLSKHRLISVTEPKPFSYHFIVQTPAACNNKQATKSTLHIKQEANDPIISAAEIEQYQLDGNLSLAYNLLHNSFFSAVNADCIQLNTGWWGYKYCWLRELSQFHKESQPSPQQSSNSPNNQLVTTAEYSLGHFDAKSYNLSSLVNSFSIHLSTDGSSGSYVQHNYTEGTLCDVDTKKHRDSAVRFFCDLSLTATNPHAAIVRSVVEASTCSYIVNIATAALCAHHSFKPQLPTIYPIICTQA
jgi:hypothetical protein